MGSGLQRIFGIRLPGFPDAGKTGRLPLEQVRVALQGLVQDCRDLRTQRLVYQINMARTPEDLWQLRSDLHQCIAQAHSQAEAVTRINSLLTVFEGWLPASQLTRI